MSSTPFGSVAGSITDTFGRPLGSLRLSVTDRCNLRCKYCMPEEEYAWLPRETILSFEEMYALTGFFTDLGIEKVRVTGGEPLLRKDLPTLIRVLLRNMRVKASASSSDYGHVRGRPFSRLPLAGRCPRRI